jgi:hypothetical protein
MSMLLARSIVLLFLFQEYQQDITLLDTTANENTVILYRHKQAAIHCWKPKFPCVLGNFFYGTTKTHREMQISLSV